MNDSDTRESELESLKEKDFEIDSKKLDLSRSEHPEEKFYDKVSREYGYGSIIWKIIIAVFCMLITSGFSSIVLGATITAYKVLLNLSDSQVSLIGCIFFIGKGLGTFFVGYLTYLTNRTIMVRILLVIIFLANTINAIWLNLPVLIVTRSFSGLAAGMIEILSINILCEYLPILYRSIVLNLIWCSYSLAQIFLGIIMSFTMPNMEPMGIRKTLFYFDILILLCLIIAFLLISDSPRNLILQGKEEEGFKIISKMKNDTYLSVEMKEKIVEEMKEGENHIATTHACKKIFGKKYLLFTICIAVNLFSTCMMIDGTSLVTTIILKKVNEQNGVENPSSPLISSSLLIASVNLLSYFCFGFFSEFQSLGRKNTIFIGLSLIVACLIPCIFLHNQLTYFFAALNLFYNVNNLIIAYASEVYPTKFRDIALGCMMAFAYSGSAISQFLFVVFIDYTVNAPFYIMIVLGVICATIICFSPYESVSKPLDSNNEKIANN